PLLRRTRALLIFWLQVRASLLLDLMKRLLHSFGELNERATIGTPARPPVQDVAWRDFDEFVAECAIASHVVRCSVISTRSAQLAHRSDRPMQSVVRSSFISTGATRHESKVEDNC